MAPLAPPLTMSLLRLSKYIILNIIGTGRSKYLIYKINSKSIVVKLVDSSCAEQKGTFCKGFYPN